MKFNFTSSDQEEEKLVKDALKDKERFSEIYTKYKPLVQNFVRKRLSADNYTIEEITSNVFYKAFSSFKSFRWQGISISAWLIRITRNTIIDTFRTSKEHLREDLEKTTLLSKEKQPEEAVLADEFENQIKNLLKTLKERERSIIYMKFFEGYSNITISKLVGLSETNVSSIIYRAVEKMRKGVIQ